MQHAHITGLLGSYRGVQGTDVFHCVERSIFNAASAHDALAQPELPEQPDTDAALMAMMATFVETAGAKQCPVLGADDRDFLFTFRGFGRVRVVCERLHIPSRILRQTARALFRVDAPSGLGCCLTALGHTSMSWLV